MKTWLVLKILSSTLASIGPLPYDLAECVERSKEFNKLIDNTFKDAKKVAELQTTWPMLTRADVGYVCVESVERPKITN